MTATDSLGTNYPPDYVPMTAPRIEITPAIVLDNETKAILNGILRALTEIAENLSGIEELTYKVDALSDAMGEFNNELD
jgi:hypothetical protein